MQSNVVQSILAALVWFGCRSLAAQEAVEPPSSQLCNAEGAFGIRFGERTASTQAPKRTMFFGRGCYQVNPPAPHPFFDTYAACTSEFDGKIYLIQALKVFNDKPPQGTAELTSSQVESNRRLGQQVLDSLLNQHSSATRAMARVDDETRTWELPVEKGIRLEVSNYVKWAVTLDCRNEPMLQQVFQKRIQGSR